MASHPILYIITCEGILGVASHPILYITCEGIKECLPIPYCILPVRAFQVWLPSLFSVGSVSVLMNVRCESLTHILCAWCLMSG